MDVYLQQSLVNNLNSEIQITGSKSESNRLLILQALFTNITIKNLSNSDDSQVLQKALASTSKRIDIHHAGTAMRFLTAYYAIQVGNEVTLTGSARMQQRPIGVLVDALQELGADITYLKEEGYPPLLIKGKALTKNKVSLKADVSSQYISALLLIAPVLKNGLSLTLKDEITSTPYLKMTLALLEKIGVQTNFENNIIKVKHNTSRLTNQALTVESDWSSASYFYSLVALSTEGTQIKLSSYFKKSLQGDSVLTKIYEQFGVQTEFHKNTITLKNGIIPHTSHLTLNLKNTPDIAQTITVTCFGLGISCCLTGLHTLKIKETDRLIALQTELEKLGASVVITEDSLQLSPSKKINKNISIATYQDHRMAMAFAPLALKTTLTIKNAEVVSKSYPTFWENLKAIGVVLN